jgi:hypothetical protein
MREINQLVKAEMDMRLVADAAEALSTTDYVPCERIVETGLVVAYCRAFTNDDKRREPVTVTMAPKAGQELELHSVLFKMRDTLYAHSDESPGRGAYDPFGEHAYVEGYRPINPGALPRIAALARRNQEAFRIGVGERSQALRDAGVPADPTL